MAEDGGQTGWGVPEGKVETDERKVKEKTTQGDVPQANKDLFFSAFPSETLYMIKTIKYSITLYIKT